LKDYIPNVMHRLYGILLCFLVISMVLGMLFVGLYPFNFSPPNRASFTEDGGIQFFGRGIAYRSGTGVWPPKNPVTLELVLQPERTYHHRTPHILSLCDRSGHEVMYLGQWEDSLIIRLVEDNVLGEEIQREIGADNVLRPGLPVHISLVLNKGKAEIYSNGELVRKYDDFGFSSAALKRPIHTLVVGNAPTGDSSWRGKVMDLNVLSGLTDPASLRNRYEQKNASPGQGMRRFMIPETLTPIRREFLSLSSLNDVDERSFYKDVFINVAGFVPLGLALSMLFSGIPIKKNAALYFLIPVLTGGLLSLFIETSQSFLLSRSSSMTDLVLNMLGSGIGVVVYLGGEKIISNLKFRIPDKNRGLHC